MEPWLANILCFVGKSKLQNFLEVLISFPAKFSRGGKKKSLDDLPVFRNTNKHLYFEAKTHPEAALHLPAGNTALATAKQRSPGSALPHAFLPIPPPSRFQRETRRCKEAPKLSVSPLGCVFWETTEFSWEVDEEISFQRRKAG